MLDNSRITSMRDLGTNLSTLQTLSLADSGLAELDGISALSCLRELRLANNSIHDLTPLATHESLQILDLKGNEVDDFGAAEMLGTCGLLYSLDLRKNFISEKSKNYREVVCYHIPQLKVLDGRHVAHHESDAVDDKMLERSVKALNELAEGRRIAREKREKDSNGSLGKGSAAAGKDIMNSITASSDSSKLESSSNSLNQSPGQTALLSASGAGIYSTTQGSELSRGTVSLGGNAVRSILMKRRSMEDVGNGSSSAMAFASPGGNGSGSDSDSPQQAQQQKLGDIAEHSRPHTSTVLEGRQLQSVVDKEESPLFFRRPHTAIGGSGGRGKSGEGPDGRPMSASSGGLASRGRGLMVGTGGVGWSPDKFQMQRRHYSFNNKKSGVRLIDIDSDDDGMSGHDTDDSSSGDEVLCSRARMKEMSRMLGQTCLNKKIDDDRKCSPEQDSIDVSGRRGTVDNTDDDDDDDDDEDDDGGGGGGVVGNNNSSREVRNSSKKDKKGSGINNNNNNNNVNATMQQTFNDKAGMQLGFDLRGSLANISTWIEESDDEDNSSAGSGDRGGCASKAAASSALLSREALLQQCQAAVGGAQESDEAASDIERDIPYEKGPANAMSDKELIGLLKQQPKDVPQMRTRESFRRFFARMKKDRMEFLLRAANVHKETKDADKKVAKRLSLVSDVLL